MKKLHKIFVAGFYNNEKYFKPELIENLSKFSISSIHAGMDHFGFLTLENHLYTFGDNKRGQCCTSGFKLEDPKKIEFEGFSEFSHFNCGREFSIAVLSDRRTLVSSGSNDRSQLGVKTLKDRYGFIKVKEFNEDIQQIACGGNHSFVLTNSHKIFGFGSNNFGEIGSGDLFHVTSPTELTSIYSQIKENCIQIASGLHHTVFLTESGKVYTVGRGYEGQLGVNMKQSLRLVKVNIPEAVKSIHCGNEFSMALGKSGKLYFWGIGLLEYGSVVRYKAGQLSRDIDSSLIKILDENVTHVTSGPFHCLYKKGDEIYGSGLSSDGQIAGIPKENESFIHINEMKSSDLLACSGYCSMFAIKEN